MKSENHALTTEFVLQVFSSFHEHQLTLFVMFLALYILTLAGNIITVIIIRIDHYLHTPMYFLLSQLSIMDTLFICTTVPKLLVNMVSNEKTISFVACSSST